MIKSKQTEREGKRDEGDVKKEQRHLHHTLKELDIGKSLHDTAARHRDRFFTDAVKKRFDSEKSLSKNLDEKDRLEREFIKKREQVFEFESISGIRSFLSKRNNEPSS